MEHDINIYETYKFCMNEVLIEAIKELERNISNRGRFLLISYYDMSIVNSFNCSIKYAFRAKHQLQFSNENCGVKIVA